ncbi:interferon-induced very large GTPase 1-like, partial [Myxocyprinus asiaticus]|uniref:interferon-induced very large GTPase 1-like n=1 Tax=Myxocyprinus asiaticus TaxID=70543 RepID=UPI0022218DC1
SNSSHSNMEAEVPNLSIVLCGESVAVQFGQDNILLGEDPILQNVEASVNVHLKMKLSDRQVSVINIIGCHETELNPVDEAIGKLLDENDFHAFIFVVRLGQFTDADKMSTEWLQRVFGDRVLQFMMILFTYEKEEECDSIIDDLKKNSVLEQLLEKCGGRYHTCSKIMNNQSEMRELMNKIDQLFKENKQQCYTSKLKLREDKSKLYQRATHISLETMKDQNRHSKMDIPTMTDESSATDEKHSRQDKDKYEKINQHPHSDQTEILEDHKDNELTVKVEKNSQMEVPTEKLEETFQTEGPTEKLETSEGSDSRTPLTSDEEEQAADTEDGKTQTPVNLDQTKKQDILTKKDDILGATESPDSFEGMAKMKRDEAEQIFSRIRLVDKNFQKLKLKLSDFLQVKEDKLKWHEPCEEEHLVQSFIQRLLMIDYRARFIPVKEVISEKYHTQVIQDSDKQDYGEADAFDNIFEQTPKLADGKNKSDPIHPMDIQMAVFHCADSFLKQLMVTKLSQCQYALPLLVPDPFTQHIEFPLWTFRQINKSWKTIDNNTGKIISKIQPVYKVKTPMVCFFRFGSVSSSKSQMMSSLINEKHNTFFHKNCPGSSKTRVLMDGVVEIAWYCPSQKNTDKFTDCVAFCNLHGDAGDHEKQLQIMTEMSSVNVVILPQLDRNDKNMIKVKHLFKESKPLICLLSENDSALALINNGKYKMGLKDRNQSDVSEELRRAINDCLSVSSESSSIFRLEDMSKHSDIRVDEDDDEDCKRGKEAAQQIMRLLENKDLTEIKESLMPCQGKLWHQWCQKNKELHRPQADVTEMEISRKKTDLKKIRDLQHTAGLSEFMRFFIKEICLNTEWMYRKKKYFLKWLAFFLDEYTSHGLSALYHMYDERWSRILKLKEMHDKSEKLIVEQTELERVSEELQAATFGVEHILREIGQIYESCSSVKKNKEGLQFHFSSLPSLAAEMMISGFPLELMDGDAAHVPVIWISAVLDELIKKLGDQRVFVLSVLGIQSSGKSTMLNAMFGLQFAVSAGRCTRGAFMQLVRVSEEMKAQLMFDYILVVDTEGLRALELAGRSTRHHDNEMATFVVGLGNMTLINIFGENPSDMQDILQIVVQAFLRMKKVRLNPSCMFVHQNVSDVTAGEKNMEGRRRLQDTLDKMTKLAAKEEVCDVECFSDVITFDIQNDVKYFAQLWEGSPPMAPPNPNYCENIQELKKAIHFHVSKSDSMMLTDLKDRIHDLWDALLNEHFVFSFKNSLEIAAYRKLETKYSKWTWSLRSTMLETENTIYNKIENEAIHNVEESDLERELKMKSEKLKKSMSEFFEKDRDKDILIQWKASFEIKIKELQENIVRETKRKLNEILQQRDMKKEIDAQKTHHENTLFDKSKELALKLQHKANDEETLKKEFDSFWKQRVAKIIKDRHPIEESDISRDMKQLLSDVYKSAPLGHRNTSSVHSDVSSVPSYSEYIIFKRPTGIGEAVKGACRAVKQTFGYIQTLSQEIENQIRDLVKDIAMQIDNLIMSFNIAKMGFNGGYIQRLIDYIKSRVKEHEEGPVNYVFKNEFTIDLIVYNCTNATQKFTALHRMFREANDPLLYLEKKRGEYYSIFQKYCQGATSAAIFGEIICQKLKEPIEQSVFKRTARDLADEMRTNCESLNGNRSNLEKHILKTLAEKADFGMYISYIHNPREHFKRFIRNEVSQHITKFSVNVLPKMEMNMKLLQQKIMKAAHESTEHVKVNSGDVDLWLKCFTQKLSDVLIFSEKDLSGVSRDDVDDFNLLEDVMKKTIPSVMSDISSEFNTEIFDKKLDYKDRPDEILINHLCQCCWVQCPFCAAICTNTIENHDGDHNVPLHRVNGISGMSYRGTENLCIGFCTTLVQSAKEFYPCAESDQSIQYKEYRSAGEKFANWNITTDLSELPYWKWFVCCFQTKLEDYYKKTFEGKGEIPDEWKQYTKQEAIDSVDKYI